MERRFDMSDFERSLKDHADQFKLMPSKRVWNGIYNNLHPGSKWPSISIAIVFIITLISIGNLNNSPIHSENNPSDFVNTISNKTDSGNQIANNISTQNNFSERKSVDEQSGEKRSVDEQSAKMNTIKSGYSKSNLNISLESKPDKVFLKTVSIESKNEKNGAKTLSVNEKNKNRIIEQKNSAKNEKSNQAKIVSIYQDNSVESLPIIQNNFLSETINSIKKEFLIPASFQPLFEPMEFSSLFDLINNTDSKPANNTDFNSQKNNASVAHTKKIRKKKNKNIEWTFYAAPTIGSVSFNKKRNIPSLSSNVSSVIVLPNDPSFGLRRTVKTGFETGAEMSYKISKKFKFITGAHLSYSGYNNMSNLIHPTFASLTFVDKNSGSYSKSYVTNYGNGQSPNRIPLTNYSFEVSVPLGLQYNIWGNEKIQITAVSTVDPSIVLKKNAFIISSDGRYYINDPSLARNVNLAGHFGSYITFSAKKIKWHIGPDIRYQLLSTYKSYYPAREHFIDYGIRIGISR